MNKEVLTFSGIKIEKYKFQFHVNILNTFFTETL